MSGNNLLRLKCPACVHLRTGQLSVQIRNHGQWQAYSVFTRLNIDKEPFSIMRALSQHSLIHRFYGTTPMLYKYRYSSMNTVSSRHKYFGAMSNGLPPHKLFETLARKFYKETGSVDSIDIIGSIDAVQTGDRIGTVDTCQFVSEISRCESSQQLLAHFNKHINSTNYINVSVLADYLITLHSLAYKELSSLPWLHHHNRTICYMQLVMNKTLESSMAHITESEDFHKLISLVIDRVEEMTNNELTQALTHALWIAVPPTHTFSHAMLEQLHTRVASMNFAELTRVTEWNRACARVDFKIMELAIQRYMELVENLDSVALGSLSDEVISDICTFYLNSFHLSSVGMEEKIIVVIDQWLSVHDTENLSTFSTIGRFCKQLLPKVLVSAKKSKRDLMDKLYGKCLKVLQDGHVPVRPYHIAEICHAFKHCQMYHEEFSNIMQERSIAILQSETLSIAQISNLSFAFSHSTPQAIKRLVEDQIYRHLGDADELILSNIGDSLMAMNCSNTDLITAYQRYVLHNMNTLIAYASRFSKVFRFIMRHDFQDSTMSSTFQGILYRTLDGQYGVRTWNVAILAEYLLPRIQHVIPLNLYNRLLLIIPRCSLLDIRRIINGLNQLRKPWIRQLHNQVLELHTALHQNITQQIHNVESLSSLHPMVIGLYLRTRKKDPGLLDQLINQYPRFTKQMSVANFRKTLGIMSQLMYFHPDILDDLMNFGIDNVESVGTDKFGRLVYLMSRVGHCPQRVEEFTSSAVQVFLEQRNDENMMAQLHLALGLAIIQIYPDTILNSIFSVDFIAELDKMIEGESENREMIQRSMMSLNRCVVLECPHLDVPWFHEEYCKERYSHEQSDSVSSGLFRTEVEDALQEGLGGQKYFKTSTFSPYYYNINYECLLNNRGQPVITELAGLSDTQELGLQRVAVLILAHNAFCMNSKRLNGHQQMKQRHLEILGYKVVHISHYDWNSMALSTWSDKVDFVQQKILS